MWSHFIIMHIVSHVFIGIFLTTDACEGGWVIRRVILHQSEYGTLYSCFSLKSQDMMKNGVLSWMWQWILQFQKRAGISWPALMTVSEGGLYSIDTNRERERVSGWEGGGEKEEGEGGEEGEEKITHAKTFITYRRDCASYKHSTTAVLRSGIPLFELYWHTAGALPASHHSPAFWFFLFPFSQVLIYQT